MKVYQGKHVKWFGPYQLAEKLCFWAKKVPDENGVPQVPEWVHNFGTWLAEDRHGNDSWLMKFLTWCYDHRKRKVKVQIDYYDTWDMPSNLAYIILPMLKQLKERMDGAPKVDNSDVPEELRSTEEDEWVFDEKWQKRWDFVLGEMIWAFEHLIPDNNWEDDFYNRHGICDYSMEEIKGYYERIDRGLILFGKYFRSLSN